MGKSYRRKLAASMKVKFNKPKPRPLHLVPTSPPVKIFFKQRVALAGLVELEA
jgi:hypothetical protein